MCSMITFDVDHPYEISHRNKEKDDGCQTRKYIGHVTILQ